MASAASAAAAAGADRARWAPSGSRRRTRTAIARSPVSQPPASGAAFRSASSNSSATNRRAPLGSVRRARGPAPGGRGPPAPIVDRAGQGPHGGLRVGEAGHGSARLAEWCRGLPGEPGRRPPPVSPPPAPSVPVDDVGAPPLRRRVRSVTSGGVKITTTASTSPLEPSRSTTWPYCSAVAEAMRSTGLPTPAPGASNRAQRRLTVPPRARGPRGVGPRKRPLPARPVHRRWRRSPPDGRRGSGWWASTSATSNSSSMVSTRTTPVWWHSASTAWSELAMAAVCEEAARVPALDRPAFTATIGLVRADPAGDAVELASGSRRTRGTAGSRWSPRPAPTRSGGRCR